VPEANIVADGLPGRIGSIVTMAADRLRQLFWHVADDVNYLLMLATSRILDALAGPEPETPADRERMERVRSIVIGC
jgi:hypothetical protein